MKYLAMALLCLLVASVVTRVRLRFVWLFFVACIAFMILGCATERAPPGPKAAGVCNGTLDGSYLFINCRRIYP